MIMGGFKQPLTITLMSLAYLAYILVEELETYIDSLTLLRPSVS